MFRKLVRLWDTLYLCLHRYVLHTYIIKIYLLFILFLLPLRLLLLLLEEGGLVQLRHLGQAHVLQSVLDSALCVFHAGHRVLGLAAGGLFLGVALDRFFRVFLLLVCVCWVFVFIAIVFVVFLLEKKRLYECAYV